MPSPLNADAYQLLGSQGHLHAFLRGQDFERSAAFLRVRPGRLQQPVHHFVAVLRLVVEQDEPPDAGLLSEGHRLFIRRVTPAAVHGELRRRVHRVVDQQVHALQERYEILAPRGRHLVMPARAQLVVGHVPEAGAAFDGRQPKSQRRPRVPQLHRPHSELTDRELGRVHLLYRQLRRQRVERDGEHGRIHLLAEDRFERRGPLPRSPDAHGVARSEERLEVGQALNVVPVGVRQQNLHFHRPVLLFDQMQPQRPDARPRVQNHELTPGALNGDTRRIATVARGLGPGGRDATPGPPEGHRVGHVFGHAVTRAKLLKTGNVEQAAASPIHRDAPHDRPAACSSVPRSRMRMSLRLTSISPLSTNSRIVRDTVSREEPIIWAMVWWVRRRVMRWPSVSSARSSSSWATRPCTSSRTRLPTFSSTRRRRRDSSLSSASAMPGVCIRMPWKSSRRSTRRALSSIAMTCAERGSSSISAISPKNSPSPSTDRITSRPSSPIRTTFTWPLATTYNASPGSSSNRMTEFFG